MHGYARLARKMMDEHGLTDWKIAWSRAKKTHGLCNYATRTLTFSAVAFAHIDEAEVRNTILHEIAHVFAGGLAGHGPSWQRIHRSIGGTGEQYVSKTASKAIPTAWVGKCRNGHESNGQHRAPLRVKFCAKCSPRWKPENVFVWYKNGRRMHVTEMPVRYQAEARTIVNQYAACKV
jgi:predicted SprT family Zn-dependent metalloprotease